ncbi:MAG: hypothetical protein JXR52_03140 [Bacteroidales bacterium]|nr:hypothetical protein [Bacteroidales bacterium]MBN2697791.1 hypothetical protein [Bacteroidales bacterium]
MNRRTLIHLFSILLILAGCSRHTDIRLMPSPSGQDLPFVWENASIYFLLTDRFQNGDPSNDINFGRTGRTAPLRGFMGGDLKGITRKIEEGYFDKLGVTAIWITPFFEQIHGGVDEGTGFTYGFHGYWTRDWTALDPNFGTEADLGTFISTAHAHGIRVLMDVIINHTGPVTGQDPLWPDDWVRTEPKCSYRDYQSTVTCTLTDNLPDIRTESDEAVDLPGFLKNKWMMEGRFDEEMQELDAFFARTGYPRVPRYYLIKWLVDYVRKFGFDGYRLDTAKHIEESVWAELEKEAERAFKEWKKANPGLVPGNHDFFIVGEVYNYGISGGKTFDFGDRKVDYFSCGMDGLINFGFKWDARESFEALFSKYDSLLHGPLAGHTVLNYVSSHDDGSPYDRERLRPLEAGTRLLLCPGAAQIYYGDETGRPLDIEGADGDAKLRSFMNWEDIEKNSTINGVQVRDMLLHWQKLGQFRKEHPSVGAGRHRMISKDPYLFARTYQSGQYSDITVIGLDLKAGKKLLEVGSLFPDGTGLKDYYSGQFTVVKNGLVRINTPFDMVLLGRI